MAADAELTARVQEVMPADAVQKPMFGGLAFMLNGNLAVSVGPEDFMVRVGKENADEALATPGASPCVMGDRTMRAWVVVDPTGLDDTALTAWVQRGIDFAQSLPEK